MKRTKANRVSFLNVKAYHGGIMSDEDIKKIPCDLMEAFIHPLDRTKEFKNSFYNKIKKVC